MHKFQMARSTKSQFHLDLLNFTIKNANLKKLKSEQQITPDLTAKMLHMTHKNSNVNFHYSGG